MITYKFPQFLIEIVNPVITVDMRSLRDNAIDNLLTADVILEAFNEDKQRVCRYMHTCENMPYNENWYNEDVLPMCLQKLEEYKIENLS